MKDKKAGARTLMTVVLAVGMIISIVGIILMFAARDESILTRKIMFSVVLVLLEISYIIKYAVLDSKNSALKTTIASVLIVALGACLWIF